MKSGSITGPYSNHGRNRCIETLSHQLKPKKAFLEVDLNAFSYYNEVKIENGGV